ncbi:MAG: outer membrane lipoprotein-sorting protein [Pseudomonadales bacterium]|nr:outer membrane lipoprotein-sorting protein [Pseudomonadales bacterium]
MKKNSYGFNTVIMVVVLLFCISVTKADEAREIMDKVDQLQRKTADSTLSKARLSSCKFGKTNRKVACVEKARVKLMESVSKQLGSEKKDSQSISILLEPASERGIGMLTYSYDDTSKDTESWLYLSALGRVKRMASGTGEDQEPVSLFGSEFTTEDMESGKMDEYDFKILKEGAFGKHQVWVIEARPKTVRLKKTNYSKVLFWIDKKRYISLKVQNYDKREKLLKKIMFKNIEQINGLWIARDTTLINVQTQRLSRMKNLEIAIGVDVDDEFLTQRTLTDFAYRERELENLRQHIQ